MATVSPPAVVDGVVYGRSLAKTAGLIALCVLGGLFGLLLVFGYFNEREPGRTYITWWGLAIGLLLVFTMPIMSLLLARALLVRRRLVVGVDRLQMVERLRGEDVVVLQIPFANIAEMKYEAVDDLTWRLGIDLEKHDDPDSHIRFNTFTGNKASDGRHFSVTGGYAASTKAITKELKQAYDAWMGDRAE